MNVDTGELETGVDLGSSADHQVLEFVVGDDVFGVDVDELVLIDDDVSVTRLPRSPGAVRGITDMRGDVTAIVDPRVVLGIEASGAERYLLVTEGRGERQKVGLLADDVMRVRSYDDHQVDDPAEIADLEAPGLDQAVVEGVIRREDDDGVTLVGLLSLDALIGSVGGGPV